MKAQALVLLLTRPERRLLLPGPSYGSAALPARAVAQLSRPDRRSAANEDNFAPMDAAAGGNLLALDGQSVTRKSLQVFLVL